MKKAFFALLVATMSFATLSPAAAAIARETKEPVGITSIREVPKDHIPLVVTLLHLKDLQENIRSSVTLTRRLGSTDTLYVLRVNNCVISFGIARVGEDGSMFLGYSLLLGNEISRQFIYDPGTLLFVERLCS